MNDDKLNADKIAGTLWEAHAERCFLSEQIR